MTEKTIVLPPNPGGNGADASYRLTVMVPKRRFLSYLRNRWWVVLVCLALTVGSTVAYETLRQETYISTAELYLTLGAQLGTSIFAEPKDDYATQIELLKGVRLQREALESLGPEIAGRLKDPVKVEVVRPMGTSILKLQATSSDGSVSQQFLQALIDRYLEFKKKTRLDTSKEILVSLNDELDSREALLQTNQERWAAFQKTNNVILMEEEAKTASLYLADLNTQVQKLTLDRQLLEEGLAPAALPALTNIVVPVLATNAVAGGTNAVTGATNFPALLSQASDLELKNVQIALAETRAKRYWMSTNKTESMAAHAYDDTIAQLELEVPVLESAAAAERKENAHKLDQSIADRQVEIPGVEAQLRNANDVLSQAQLIKDEIQRQQSSYDSLLAMKRNVDLTKNMEQEKITPLEPPTLGIPAPRSLPFRIALASAGGLFLALGLVFAWHLLDDRLVSIHDLKDQFGETVLGLVPRVRVPKAKPQVALLAKDDPRAGYVESYRHLRSALLLSSLGEGRPQTLLVTGTIPAEGKTTIAVNLARMLAQSGQRVALVDADLRGGRIHQMIGKEGGPGFLDFLRGEAAAGAIIYPTEMAGLSFVPSGTVCQETDKLLAHPNLGELMKALKDGRDFVILDGAPILATDDASLMVPFADAVVMVMRPFYTRARQARRALEMLYQRQAKQVTLVLNRAHADDLAGEYYTRKGSTHAAKNGKA